MSEGSNFWRYGWDHENRLVSAGTRKQTVKYKYDALGRRVERTLGFGRERTKFTYDGDDVLVDDDKGTLTKYLNGEGIDSKVRAQSGTAVNYFLADHLGSTNGLADSSGSVSASFELRFVRKSVERHFFESISVHRTGIRPVHRPPILPRPLV